MTEQEKIEGMCRTMAIYLDANKCEDICEKQGYCPLYSFAEELYSAGYRKADEVRKETAKEILLMIDSIPTNEVNELNHLYLLKQNIYKKYGVEVEK